MDKGHKTFLLEGVYSIHWMEVEFVPYVPQKQKDSLLLLHRPCPKKERTERKV